MLQQITQTVVSEDRRIHPISFPQPSNTPSNANAPSNAVSHHYNTHHLNINPLPLLTTHYSPLGTMLQQITQTVVSEDRRIHPISFPQPSNTPSNANAPSNAVSHHYNTHHLNINPLPLLTTHYSPLGTMLQQITQTVVSEDRRIHPTTWER